MITAANGTVLWRLGYTWKKYNVVTKVVEGARSSVEPSWDEQIYCWKSVDTDLNGSGGRECDTALLYIRNSLYKKYPYFKVGWNSGVVTGKCTGGSEEDNSVIINYRKLSTAEAQGTYIEDVTATDADAYPDNGKHTDGYWYVKQT